jgi:hypothetical protein
VSGFFIFIDYALLASQATDIDDRLRWSLAISVPVSVPLSISLSSFLYHLHNKRNAYPQAHGRTVLEVSPTGSQGGASRKFYANSMTVFDLLWELSPRILNKDAFVSNFGLRTLFSGVKFLFLKFFFDKIPRLVRTGNAHHPRKRERIRSSE